ncbi:MAG: aminotransferase class I/II-fold pyridoxal phosphate-dependent enzyme, partial [Nitrososphaera sp.]
MVSKRNSLDRYARERLSSIRRQALYRQLQTVIVGGATCRVNGREAIHLCSNDYLGLSKNKRIAKKTIESMEEISQCSSRLIAGNHPRLIELEDMLADHRRTEAALVYPSGYSANIGVVTSIAGRGSTIFSDELNHASIIDA